MCATCDVLGVIFCSLIDFNEFWYQIDLMLLHDVKHLRYKASCSVHQRSHITAFSNPNPNRNCLKMTTSPPGRLLARLRDCTHRMQVSLRISSDWHLGCRNDVKLGKWLWVNEEEAHQVHACVWVRGPKCALAFRISIINCNTVSSVTDTGFTRSILPSASCRSFSSFF